MLSFFFLDFDEGRWWVIGSLKGLLAAVVGLDFGQFVEVGFDALEEGEGLVLLGIDCANVV